MTFRNLTDKELALVAEFFAVDVKSAKEKPTKKELLAALAEGENPVTWEDYETVYLKANPKPEEKKEEEKPADPEVEQVVELPVVLKMERANGRYDIRGYTFTKDHPYRPVTREDADWIVTHEEGFRVATTQEVADYYS